MGSKIKKSEQHMVYYRKKRNKILFFLLIAFVLLLGVFAIFNYTEWISEDLSLSILLILVLLYLVAFLTQKNRIDYYTMKYQHERMIVEDLGPKETYKQMFTQSWLNQFEKEGFKKASETNQYILYYKTAKQLEYVKNNHLTLLFVAVAKQDSLDFYGNEIDEDMIQVIQKDQDAQRAKHQVVFQFKKYKDVSNQHIEDLREIIHFKQNNNYLVHISAGYFESKQKAYFLMPKRIYPSKFYYYACHKMMDYCYMKDDQDE